MPVHIAGKVWQDGISSVPYGWTLLKLTPVVAVIYLLKLYFNGAVNTSERNMHSKVVMVTGGTSGIGAEVTKGLASRGAQIVLLTQHALTDAFLVDYIEDLRAQTGNELITAEQVDLASLHSIRKFATKWVDNAPPRRLDMVVLCANTRTPSGASASFTEDGLEATWGLNYMANFHLLSILSPALRAQPPDRDVRIIFGTCSSYLGGMLPVSTAAPSQKGKKETIEAVPFTPSTAYATSKLALMTFALAFQKHLSSYARPDKNPVNSRVIIVDPGWTRTPGMRRLLTLGSLWGLLVYVVTWPLWWLFLKSSDQGAQTFLYAAMEAQYGRGEGGWFLKECRQMGILKDEVKDEALQKKLWEVSEEAIKILEQEGAKKRAAEKKSGDKGAAEGKETKAETKTKAKAKTTATKENGAAKQRKGN
ncbi:NAD(P)-binding protein [Karstenula rhodostoma CBS 690.94]|uniref:NAD(P)-binding protein n=1 Tax=Karstenula rhodostoma CBS 690.94 TaxID=1392251 RepID=A0A9P4PMQ2_9PLEO|nr:NAD(P)-binding protein [Karstenula rhodostoma CBS 690.94]